MKALKAFWKRSKLWLVLGLSAAITALQFVFWRKATKKRRGEPPKPLKNTIEKAEVEAIEARVRAESDSRRIRKRIEAAAKKDTEAQISDLGDLLLEMTADK